MSKNGFSDQIAYRAANYVDQLGLRDESPSKAARFAAIRYLKIVEQGRREVYGYFSKDEINVLIDRAYNVDWTISDNFDTFWARIQEYCERMNIYPNLADRLRKSPRIILETLIDMMRERKYGNVG